VLDAAILAATGLASDADWTDIAGVRLVGVVIGTLLVVAAIRAMFGRRK
jgi:hypothetical protein